jgi:hypothetical protein
MKLLSNIKFLWIVILVLIILNIASIATHWIKQDEVWDRSRRFSFRTGQRDHFLKQELNLTPVQQVRFDSLMIGHRSQLESLVAEIRSLREELMGMIRNQEFTAEAEELVREIGKKQQELELLNYQHFRDVLGICNEEQKQVFLETIKRAVGPRHERPEHRNPDPDFRERGRRRGGN